MPDAYLFRLQSQQEAQGQFQSTLWIQSSEKICFLLLEKKVMRLVGDRQQQSGGQVDQSWLSEERGRVGSCPSLSSCG